MHIQYDGEIEDEKITDIIERVLVRYGLEDNKKQVSNEILAGLEDLFIESSY